MKTFEREDRYMIIKRKDMECLSSEQLVHLIDISTALAEYREQQGKQPLQAVVIEHDWPEFEKVWQMIEERCSHED